MKTAQTSTYVIAAALLTGCAAHTASRTVVYDPTATVPLAAGAQPSFVQGPVDLAVEVRNANPFCYAYAVKIGLTALHPATPLATPASAAAAAAGGVVAAYNVVTTCDGLTGDPLFKCALQGIQTAQDNLLGAQESVGKIERTLSYAWEACAGIGPDAGDVSKQRTSILDAGTAISQNLQVWSKDLASASVAAGVVAQTSAILGEDDVAASQSLATAKAAQTAGIDQHLPAAQIAVLDAAVAKAQKESNQADTMLKAAASLSAASEAIIKLQGTVQTVTDAARTDVAAALALIGPKAPTVTSTLASQHVDVNQAINVEVTQTRLVNGKVPDKANAESLGVGNLYTLRPIWVDVGIGPSLTFRNTRAYGLDANHEVALTQDALNIDGVITFSVYWFEPRYLDGTTVAWKQLIPRPTLGASLTQPFSSLYLGLQVDPFLQFLDISFGWRVYSETQLLGPPEGSLANKDAMGNPVAPSTKMGLTAAPFLSVSASTDLFVTWLKSIVKP